jgi:glycine dehydrogenase subunit 2
VAFKAILAPFAPAPVIVKDASGYRLDHDRPQSVGRLRSFNSQFGMVVRAYTYIRELGADGLAAVSDLAVLNANYLASLLQKHYPLAYEGTCMHEAVFTDAQLEKETGVKTLDVAKRLLDYGFHSPTVYFPLVVKGAMMIEPTETESKETIEAFVDAMIQIKEEAQREPELVKTAPHTSHIGRLDEARAARKPVLRWRPKPAV